MNGPSPVQPVGCWQVITTGAGIVLVAAGAILRFAVPATFIHGVDLRVAGVIVMLPGVVALLLSLLVWGPLSRRRTHPAVTAPGGRRSPGSGGSTRTSRQREGRRRRDRESRCRRRLRWA